MTNKLECVYALNLYLFAFKLQSGLTNDLQSVNNRSEVVKTYYQPILERLKSQFGEIASKPQIIPDNPEVEQLELLRVERKDRQFFSCDSLEQNSNPTQPKPCLRLLLYPQKIEDTYSLLLHLYRPQDKGYDQVKLTEIKQEFQPQAFKIKDDKSDFLGQTLLVTAFLPQNTETNHKNLNNIAEQLRYHLFGEYCNTFYQAGDLLGSYIVEYGNPKGDRNRILILLYLQEETPQKLKPIYWNLPEFFLYYHKIASSFQFSRLCYQEADAMIRENIEQELREILKDKPDPNSSEIPLEIYKQKLKKLIDIAPKYALKLRNLEYTLNTLQIHGGNYERTLKRLQKQTGDDLEFFTRFLHRECQTFPLQVQADLNYLKPASNLLDQAIASIRGLVEIEQAKLDRETADLLSQSEAAEKERDKSLERTISTLGVGLGAGGIASSITSAYLKQPLTLSYHEHPFSIPPLILAFLLSFGIAAIAGFITWKITQRWK